MNRNLPLPAPLSECLSAHEGVFLCTCVCVCVCAGVPYSGYHTQISLEHPFRPKIRDSVCRTSLPPAACAS